MQNNRNQSTRRSSKSSTSMISVTLADNTKVKVDAKSISGWTKYSGTASDGSEVHSLHAKEIGKSTVIRDNQGNTFSCLTNELEVLAKTMFGSKISAQA